MGGVSDLFKGEVLTLLMIGLALSMDAFSLGLGLGAQGLRWRDVARLTVAIAALHVLFPLLSIWVGEWLRTVFGTVTQEVAALIMMLLGSRMAIAAVTAGDLQRQVPIQAGWWQILVFASGVSVDALSIGLSLGTSDVPAFLASGLFGLQSGLFALIGLSLGKKVNQTLGTYGQIMGGAVLVILGLRFFW